MPLTCYIAAPWQSRDTARMVRQLLIDNGLIVGARWIVDDQVLHQYVDYPRYADESEEDVRLCDVLVALNPPGFEQSGTGGRHVEFGMALTRGRRIILVGERSDVFHHNHTIENIPWADWNGLLLKLGRRQPTTDKRGKGRG